MPLSITVLRTELREHLGLDEDELDSTAADALLNRSWWEVMDKLDFREKESKTTFDTVIGTPNYDMPMGYDALLMLSISGADETDTLRVQLDRSDQKIYEQEHDEAVTAYAKPTKYHRYNDGIWLAPTPDKVYTINVNYLTTLEDLSNSNATPPIPQSWHEIILYGAVWRGFMRIGDYNRKQAAQQTQIGLINSMSPVSSKEEFDSSLAGLNFIRRAYR